MRLKRIELRDFKRFASLTIDGLPVTPRLVVLTGPNGVGKSSLFDGLMTWHWANGAPSNAWDESYGARVGTAQRSWTDRVHVEFHEPLPTDAGARKKLVYARSAFRHESDFTVTSFGPPTSPLDEIRLPRMIETDVAVSSNFRRLIGETIAGVFRDEIPDETTKGELKDLLIGDVRAALALVFPDLEFTSVGGVDGSDSSVGTFYFSKGTSRSFPYKNLSGGEKAVFDLILDLVVKARYFDDSIWCIDEPEAHLNSRVQAKVLDAMWRLLPERCQLLLATHSIGYMRRAWELSQENPGSVAFLDMANHDFDQEVLLAPETPTRRFWIDTLEVALGDIAKLVAPQVLVLCEGKPRDVDEHGVSEFDARCYRTIFGATCPEVDFVSLGSSNEVARDRLTLGKTIQTVVSGVAVLRLIDRDLMSDDEVRQRRQADPHIRVLTRRAIESYLFDDEVLEALCMSVEQGERTPEVLAAKAAAIRQSEGRGHDSDDIKRSASDIFNRTRRILGLQAPGSNYNEFAISHLARLITPETRVYQELFQDVFPSDGY